ALRARLLRARPSPLPNLLCELRAQRRRVAPRVGVLLWDPFRRRGLAPAGVRRRLSPRRGFIYRRVAADRPGRDRVPALGAVPDRDGADRRALFVSLAHVLRPRHPRGLAGLLRAATDGCRPAPDPTLG